MKDIELETIKLRLEGVRLAISRSRFAFIVSMIASVAIIVAVWNASMSPDSGFARQPYWSHDRQFTPEMRQLRLENLSGQLKVPPEKVTDAKVTEVTDQVQREILSEWVKNQTISVGLLGIRISVEDFSILGSLGLMITAMMLFYSVRNENITIGNLFKHAHKFKDWDDRYLVYQGIVPHLIFLDLGDLNKPIDDFEQPTDVRKMPLTPFRVKLLLWLPALTILLVVAADMWRLFFAPNPFRPSGLPLWTILDGGELKLRLAYDAIALLFGIWASVICMQIVRYATASANLIKKYRTHLLETVGHLGGGPRSLSHNAAPQPVAPPSADATPATA